MKASVAALAVLALTAAGCGAGEEAAPGGGGDTRVEIVERDFELDPSTVTLAEPGTYTFVVVNRGDVEHALDIEGHGVEFESDTIAPGEQVELTVEAPAEGEYEMYCPIGNHRELGMDGAVVVGAGGATTGETTTGDTTTDETTTEEDDGDYRY